MFRKQSVKDDFKKHPNKTARDMSHDNFHTIIEQSNLTDMNKTILKSRFLNEIQFYDYKRDTVKKYYNTLRFLVTAGSIILPAILSIGQMEEDALPDNFDKIAYWSSWGISLVVTASNGFIQLFSLDKKYYDYSLTTEQLKSEAWEYFQLSGKYNDYCDHTESFTIFCNGIEKIKNGQIAREFSGKSEDSNRDNNNRKFMMQAPDIQPNQQPNQPNIQPNLDHIKDVLSEIVIEEKDNDDDKVEGNILIK